MVVFVSMTERSSSLSCQEKILRFSAMYAVNVGEPVESLPIAVIVVRSSGNFVVANSSRETALPTFLISNLSAPGKTRLVGELASTTPPSMNHAFVVSVASRRGTRNDKQHK